MRHKVAELEGVMLDAAVATAEGLPWWFPDDVSVRYCRVNGDPYEPSSDWGDGGPIIQRERINNDGNLAAAMRAYVASKCGEWIELPE